MDFDLRKLVEVSNRVADGTADDADRLVYESLLTPERIARLGTALEEMEKEIDNGLG